MKKRNYLTAKTGFIAIALAAITSFAFAEDYYRIYKGNVSTHLIAGSEIDSIKPSGSNLLFYKGSVSEAVALADIDSIKFDSGNITRWDFNQDGVSPAGWSGGVISGGRLNITNSGWASWETPVQAGKYTFRMYVPQINANERFIALNNLAFTAINTDYSYSIGILYGTETNRNAASPKPSTNQLLLRCYSDNPSVTTYKAIEAGWHTLEIQIEIVNTNKYYITWLLDGSSVKEAGPTTYTTAQTSFKIMCGTMSNGAWQGSVNCTQDYTAQWDYVEYKTN